MNGFKAHLSAQTRSVGCSPFSLFFFFIFNINIFFFFHFFSSLFLFFFFLVVMSALFWEETPFSLHVLPSPSAIVVDHLT